MKKLLFSCSLVLLFYCFISLAFPSLIQAQPLPTFTWVVTDQNGNPLSGAVVWINLNGTYIATCTTDASGQCSETISCAPPCQLDGQVEWQGQTGNYGGSFPDGATIPVTIDIPSPSPPPPGPSPSPGPSPDCAGYYKSCINKECCEGLIKQFGSEQTGACFCVYPTPPSSPDSLTCRPQLTGERDSRPYYNQNCDLCNMTGMYCPSCATGFTVGTTVDWTWEDKNCEDDDTIWWQADWGGTVIIDPTQTKIPFVGKKRVEDNINAREDEQKYLADYFDGTHEYYRSYDYQKAGITIYHGTNTTLLPNYQGVFRKLTPMEYQDQLKIAMIERAKETIASGGELQSGGVHDYNVSYKPRLCWDLPFLGDAAIGFARSIAGETETNFSSLFSFLANISHYCLYNFTPGIDDAKLTIAEGAIDAFNVLITSLGPLGNLFKIQTEGIIDGVEKALTEIDGNFPPEPDEEDYVEKWRAWKDSEWGRVWEAVPMVSREDTPGIISPYYNFRRLDEPKFIDPRVEKVPHVARLYESSQEIQNILLPLTGGGLISQKKAEPIIASPANGQVQGEKVLLAWSGSLWVDFSINLTRIEAGGNRYNLCYSISGHATGDCNWADWSYQVSPYTPQIFISERWSNNPTIDCHHSEGPGDITITANPGDTVCATLTIPGGACTTCCDPDPRPSFTQTSCCEIDEDGNPINCGPGSVPPANACATPEGSPVAQCELTAITDSNPNDDLCCNKINLDMSFVDAFIDHNKADYFYMECLFEEVCECPGGEICGDTGCYCPQPTCEMVNINPECKTSVYKEVTRDWGINLSHPYLTPIWEQTAKGESAGIFNIFRPAQIPPFEELDAYSTIYYSASGFKITPSEGKFYFNYLGGVQKAKEWVTTKVLMPYVEQ